jgi:hypothetical protein
MGSYIMEIGGLHVVSIDVNVFIDIDIAVDIDINVVAAPSP